MANKNAQHDRLGRFVAVPIEEQFWSKVNRTESCWNWTGEIQHDGYGKIRFNGRHIGAHRACLLLLGTSIPQGLTIDHLCRNRRCVNPKHLEVVTLRENLLRGNNICMRHATRTHCKRGHPLSGLNLRMQGKYRVCRSCQVAYYAVSNASRRAKYRLRKSA